MAKVKVKKEDLKKVLDYADSQILWLPDIWEARRRLLKAIGEE